MSNIVMIITDQQRFDAVGYINQKISTPNLTKLSKQSIIFENAFTQSPQCQPSRASIFTGRYPTAHKLWWNGINLMPHEKTLGNYLRDAGYTTAYFGKFHLHDDITYVNHFGFSNHFLFEQWQSLVKNNNIIREEFFKPMKTPTWTGSELTSNMHHDDMITEHAIRFIQTTKSKFFMVISYYGPHPPYVAPREFANKYKNFNNPKTKTLNLNGHNLSDQEWNELKRQYFGSISWIDYNIGKILQLLDNDTIIIFTSDHGDMLGDHGIFSKGVFAYDGLIRVPLLLLLPTIKPNRREYFVEHVDIAPTILSYVGLEVPPQIQSANLLDVRRKYVCSMIGYNPRLRMIRSDRWKYWICGDYEVVFDLKSDPNETTNLVGSDNIPLSMLRLDMIQKLIACEDDVPLPTG